MKTKISLKHGLFHEEDKDWVIDTYRGILLKNAEEDYVASRVMFILDRTEIAYYHLQQCIEKYLKAFVLDKDIDIVSGHKNKCSDFKKNGHKLEFWANLCGKVDDFFNDRDFINALISISDFEELCRYPQNRIQTYGSTPKQLLMFLDEFVWEMRNRIEHLQYQDIILAFLNGFTNSDPRINTMFKYSLNPEQIRDFITIDNNILKQIIDRQQE